MATQYIEYELEEGGTILIEVVDPTGATTKISGQKGNVVTKAEKTFEAAFASAKRSFIALRKQLEEVKADEVEVVFGLKTIGEAGNLVIGKAGIEANYQVTLKWKNADASKA